MRIVRLGKKMRRCIEEMPLPAYIFLKAALALSAAMLCLSGLLFALAGRDPGLRHLAVLLLETPAGVLLLSAVGLAVLLDRLQ